MKKRRKAKLLSIPSHCNIAVEWTWCLDFVNVEGICANWMHDIGYFAPTFGINARRAQPLFRNHSYLFKYLTKTIKCINICRLYLSLSLSLCWHESATEQSYCLSNMCKDASSHGKLAFQLHIPMHDCIRIGNGNGNDNDSYNGWNTWKSLSKLKTIIHTGHSINQMALPFICIRNYWFEVRNMVVNIWTTCIVMTYYERFYLNDEVKRIQNSG